VSKVLIPELIPLELVSTEESIPTTTTVKSLYRGYSLYQVLVSRYLLSPWHLFGVFYTVTSLISCILHYHMTHFMCFSQLVGVNEPLTITNAAKNSANC
jgi:hypothetical protein